MNYRSIVYECIDALSNDYTIFYSIGDIPSPTIFFTGELETLTHTHISYLVKIYIERTLTSAYKALLDNTKVSHINIDKVYTSEDFSSYYYVPYNIIKDFAKKYKLKQYS